MTARLVQTIGRMAGKENDGPAPKRGDGSASQADSLAAVKDTFPCKRNRINPKMIPANMDVVWENPRNQWERKETKRMIKRENPETLKSP
jgi:hypothetical protein